MDNSHSVTDPIYQIDGISISIEKDPSASQSTASIPGGDERNIDHQADSTDDGKISSTNSNGESKSVYTNAEYLQSITNYISHGFLIVAVAVEAIALMYYIKHSGRDHFNYVNCHVSADMSISFFEVVLLACFLVFLIFCATICRGTKIDLDLWTCLATSCTSTSLLCLLLVVGLGIGDEGVHYLFWNNQHHPIIDYLNQTSLTFSYTVNRSISDKSLRFALPPSEFYDIVAKMIDQMNLTETQKFLEKYNCSDRLSFPISFDPLLTPIRSLLGTSNSICV